MKQHSPLFLKLTADAKHHVKEVTIHGVQQKLQQKDAILIDVREKDEWDAGTIPGAIHISKGILERDIEKAIPNTKQEIILFCGGGYRSLLAAYNIQKMGYSHVASMTGGFTAWQTSRLPVSKPQP